MNDDELDEVEKMSFLSNTAHDAHARMLVKVVREQRQAVRELAGALGLVVRTYDNRTTDDAFRERPDPKDIAEARAVLEKWKGMGT